MSDHSHEHTRHCESVNVLPMRKAVPVGMCPTCKAWWAGYAAATAKLVPTISDEFEAGHVESCRDLNCPGCVTL